MLPPVEAAPPASEAVDNSPAVDADVITTAEPQWHYYGQHVTLTPVSAPAVSAAPTPVQTVSSTAQAASAEPAAPKPGSRLTLLVLKSGSVYAVSDYWIDNNSLSYVLANGSAGAVALGDMDWGSTTQLNSERGVRVILRSGQANN